MAIQPRRRECAGDGVTNVCCIISSLVRLRRISFLNAVLARRGLLSYRQHWSSSSSSSSSNSRGTRANTSHCGAVLHMVTAHGSKA